MDEIVDGLVTGIGHDGERMRQYQDEAVRDHGSRGRAWGGTMVNKKGTPRQDRAALRRGRSRHAGGASPLA